MVISSGACPSIGLVNLAAYLGRFSTADRASGFFFGAKMRHVAICCYDDIIIAFHRDVTRLTALRHLFAICDVTEYGVTRHPF